MYYNADIAEGIHFKTDNPKQEFVEYLVKNHILDSIGIKFDPVNYLPAGTKYPPLPEKYETMSDYLQAFRAVSRPGTKFFSLVNNFNANIVYIRIRRNDGTDAVVSLIINRWHNNVAFLFKEKSTLRPQKDNADFLEGFYGSYPNYFLDIRQDDLPDFFDLLAHLDKMNPGEADRKIKKYGINRANKDFWQHYDWFQQRFNREQPIRSGLFDLNRYYHKAWQQP